MTATPATLPHPDAAPLAGARRGVDVAYAVIDGLFVLAVLAQVFLAGVGAFGGHDFGPHEDLGNVLGIVAIVLFVLTLIARPGRATVIGAFILAVLTEAAQHGLAQAGDNNKWVGGVHAFDGMIILLLATWLAIVAYHRTTGS